MTAPAPYPVRELIDSRDWKDALGDLGERIFEQHLATYAEAKREASERVAHHHSLVYQSANKIIDSITGLDDLEVLKSLPTELAKKAIWHSDGLPYYKFRLLRRLLASSAADDSSEDVYGAREFLSQDIDDWILANERALRDNQLEDWKRGLVNWEFHSEIIFDSPVASLAMHSEKFIMRPTDLPGFAFLDELRPSTITVQPTISAFRTAFNKMTDGLLKGLDWSHVFVAGGSILTTLLAVTDAKVKQSASSDVDIYIYGLGPVEANAKIQHIFTVWKRNLPKEDRKNAMAVRNSGTITFFARYPLKRMQIVLKLVKDPKEVLLNFDLDVCAMGFDGENLMMLPRACRALETGYNVFTMDLVHGHYLGKRRASQESRVFKYADKGFGIRILPSYLRHDDDDSVSESSAISGDDCRPSLLYAVDVAEGAADWTNELMESYHYLGHNPGYRYPPMVTPYMLGPHNRKLRDENCLSGFEYFMRHVELWRLASAKEVFLLKPEWASATYTGHDDGYGYDNGKKNTPLYTWDSYFHVEDFKEALKKHNKEGAKVYASNVHSVFGTKVKLEELGKPMRIRFKHNIANLLSGDGDVILHIVVAVGFTAFANQTIRTALEDRGLSQLLPRDAFEILSFKEGNEVERKDWQRGVEIVKWRFDPILAWQQIDRRIDEVFEIMWAFYRTHSDVDYWTDQARLAERFCAEVGKRGVQRLPTDEMEAFSRWFTREAIPLLPEESSLGSVVVNMCGGWPLDSDFEDERDRSVGEE